MSSPQYIITRVPTQNCRTEKWSNYVDRVQSWKKEVISKRSLAGVHRPVFAVCPTSDIFSQLELLGAITTLCMISYARGRTYHPIELSRRTMAALLDFRCDRAQAKGAQMIDDLLNVGILEVVETGSGKHPSLYRICRPKSLVGLKDHKGENLVGFKDHKTPPCGLLKRTACILKKGKKKKASSSADVSDVDVHVVVDTTLQNKKEREEEGVLINFKDYKEKRTSLDETVKKIRDLFGNRIGVEKIHALIAATSLENVQRQLEWWKYRDVSSWHSGPAAAFCVMCSQEQGEPEALVAKRHTESDKKNKTTKSLEEKQKEREHLERFEQIWSRLSDSEKRGYIEITRAAMPKFMQTTEGIESSRPFLSYLRSKVITMHTDDAMEM